MGEPMAERLMDAGFTVTSCANRSRDAIERLAAKGLIECATAVKQLKVLMYSFRLCSMKNKTIRCCAVIRARWLYLALVQRLFL